MEKEGKYIYCVIGTKQERNFGPIGIGGNGNEVLTIGYDDLSMVVSNHPATNFVVNRENMLAHEKVVETAMKEFESVLPVRFGTVAAGADEVRNLLDRRRREFKNLLRDMDRKVELGVKGIWKNMPLIFKEIAEENKEIKKLKEKKQNDKDSKSIRFKIKIGKMVEEDLVKKKEKEAEEIADILRKISVDYKLNKLISNEMFINSSFLVDKGREKEFDNVMEELTEEYKERVKFMYTGPLPAYNFVNIVIYPEEWEK